MKKRCTICNCKYDTISFKGGRLCENCLNYVVKHY